MSNERSYKRPESVLIIILNHKGQVLLLKRNDPINYWQSVTGSLKWDETPDSAAARELMEETSINEGQWIKTGIINEYPIDPRWRNRFHQDTKINKEHVFYYVTNQESISIDPKEHCEWSWFDHERAVQLISSKTNQWAVINSKIYIDESNSS